MTTTNKLSSHIVWIDWMKVLAIYLIIAGHCMVPGNKFIYVFSVPTFFILSGFLSKKEEDVKLFWKKILWNLVVPMLFYFMFTTLVQFGFQIMRGTFQLKYMYEAPLLGLIGMQGKNFEAGGLKGMWFVYTLIICKILLQYSPKRHNLFYFLVLNLLFLFAAWLLNHKGIVYYNSVVNVLLAMPFFTLGYMLRPIKNGLSNLSLIWMPILLVVGIIGVFFCGVYNDIVMLYKCSYGSNLLLFLVGALCGTMVLYALSMLLKRYLVDIVVIVGGGTLVILGLHYDIIQIVNRFFPSYWHYLESLLILVAFIPVIVFIERHMPILYGKYRNQK